MEVKLFVRDDCPESPAARRACEGIANLSVYDLGNLQGRAEASSLGVMVAPSVVVVDSSGREIAGWRGETPDSSEIRAVLSN
jgi:hypothetical protein